jgi:dipeptidyl aminopeptidase/acylaminoacyl peptidase
MNDYRIYFFLIVLVVNLIAVFILFPINWIFGFIFLIIYLVQSTIVVIIYLDSIWWPYYKWIDTDCIDIEEVKIPSSSEGQYLNGVILREKNSDRKRKNIGVLFHHGYTGHKEKVYRLAIPLAMNGCVVLCPDARGHGHKTKSFGHINDWKGIAFDVEKEVDFLANLEDVDENRLAMMGHSMGATMTLVAGYQNDRLKKLVSIAGAYDMVEMSKRHKTIITWGVRRRLIKYLKKDPEFIESGGDYEEFSKRIAAKYIFEYNSPIPDKDRVYLVHCKHDDLVLFDQSTQAKEDLGLPDENVLFLEKPSDKYIMTAHNLTGQSTIIATFCVQVALSLE